MTTGHGLMGQAAFRQLRTMIDALLANYLPLSGGTVTGTLSSTGGFSGDLEGNASTADYADSASYASSADVATKANRLSAARKISFTGAATGSATFDGSADITVSLAAQSTAASFLAAHPVGCVYATTKHTNPGTLYGGTWVERPSTGAFLYERTA